MSSSQPLAEHSVDHAAPRKLRHRKRVPPLSLKKLATATAVAVAVTACNAPSDGIAYTVPDNICQIPADKEILETLLDEGKRLKQDDGGDDITEGKFCHMYVDGNDSVVSDADWEKSGYTLRDYFEFYDVKGIRYFGDGKYASWSYGVVTVMPCPGVSDKGDVIAVDVKDIQWNDKSQPLLEKLGPPYFEAYKKRLGCPS
ncbi:hypothetical protein [Streptomyces thermospinosisporus]|uniref:hypothetical protein n=1 Tax=Streptomyces thermospinosisporus TaxID=161482 RepID=UPI0031DC3245